MSATPRGWRVEITHYLGDYADYCRRRGAMPDQASGMIPPRMSSRTIIPNLTERGARSNVFAQELNADRRAPSYSYDRAIPHVRPNADDVLHCVVERWEGATYSTLYLISRDA